MVIKKNLNASKPSEHPIKAFTRSEAWVPSGSLRNNREVRKTNQIQRVAVFIYCKLDGNRKGVLKAALHLTTPRPQDNLAPRNIIRIAPV